MSDFIYGDIKRLKGTKSLFLLALKSVQIWSPRPNHLSHKPYIFCHLFKAQQGLQAYHISSFTITQLLQYYVNTSLLLIKSGDFWRLKTDTPLTYTMRICILIIINAYNNKLENDDDPNTSN